MSKAKLDPFLEIFGARLSLRPLRLDDVTARYVKWLNDPEVNALSSRYGRSSDADSCRRYLSGLAPEEVVLGIFLSQEGHVGNVKYGPIDRANGRADISILIGERCVWGKGIGREAVYLVTHHLFEVEKLNRVEAGSGNSAFVRLTQALGWRVEGVLRERVRIGARYVDWMLLAQLRGEFIERPQYHAQSVVGKS